MPYIKTLDGSQLEITDAEYQRLLGVHNWRGRMYLDVRTPAGKYIVPVSSIAQICPDNVPSEDGTVLLAQAIDRLAKALEGKQWIPGS